MDDFWCKQKFLKRRISRLQMRLSARSARESFFTLKFVTPHPETRRVRRAAPPSSQHTLTCSQLSLSKLYDTCEQRAAFRPALRPRSALTLRIDASRPELTASMARRSTDLQHQHRPQIPLSSFTMMCWTSAKSRRHRNPRLGLPLQPWQLRRVHLASSR